VSSQNWPQNPPNTAMCVTRMAAWVQLPSQDRKLADFSTNAIRTFLTYICQISSTLLRVFYPGRRNNNRHLFNSSFTHIFHPVGFPLADKSFLGNPTLKMMKKTRSNQFCRLFPPPPPHYQWESSMVYLSPQNQGFPSQIFSISDNFR
jgi:hypothetical protein